MRPFIALGIGLCIWTLSGMAFAGEPSELYADAVTQLKEAQGAHPQVSQIFSLGQNDDGVDIYAMRISRTPTKVDPQKVGQILVSTHHGNERDAATFALRFIDDLLKRYQNNADSNLDQVEWTIIPVLNISGYNANRREEHGVDPNRDYPNPCLSQQGGQLASIRLLMNLLSSRVFTGAVTVHGYAGSMTFPWGVYATDYKTADDNFYRQIFEKAAEKNDYPIGTSSDVVYPANGSFEDFVYWKYGSWSLLLELKTGSDSDIERTVPAISTFYGQLNSSPSPYHEFTAECTGHGPDLRLE